MDQSVDLRVVVPQSEVAALTAEVTAGGGVATGVAPFTPEPADRDDYLHSAFEPLTVLSCVVGLAYAADRLVRTIRSARHGGVIVDARNPALEIREHPALTAGTVLVLTPDGAQHIDASSPVEITGLLGKLADRR